MKLFLISAVLGLGLFNNAFASSGGYLDAARGAQLESCLAGKIQSAPATSLEALRLGEIWACVTLSYFWDENDQATRFVENYSQGDYRFVSATLEHGSEHLAYPRNVLDPAHPVEFTVFAHADQAGVREDVRLGLEHSIDYLVAVSPDFLLVERSVYNSAANLRARPSLEGSPYAWLDRPAVAQYERETGRSNSERYRRVTQYRGCYLVNRLADKAKVPCFGDIDSIL